MAELERNVGDPRSGYPGTEEMPELQDKPVEAPPPRGEGGGNPVIDALQTIQKFIMAQEAKGNPQAATLKQALMGFMQAMQGGEGAPAPEAEAVEGEAPPMPEEETPEQLPGKMEGDTPEAKTARGDMVANPFEESVDEEEEEIKKRSKRNTSAQVLT